MRKSFSKASSQQWPTLAIVLVAIGLVVILLISGSDGNDTPRTLSSNFNTVSDTSTGLSFNMSKKFEPIAKEDLAKLNPGFGYGFRPVDDPRTSCIISQSPLVSTGAVPPSQQLRQGLLQEIKKIHPDAKLTNPSTADNPVKFGDAQGILLQMKFKDGSSQVKRVEVLAVGKNNQVIAYCESLAADNPKYYNDFTIFFSSLKLN